MDPSPTPTPTLPPAYQASVVVMDANGDEQETSVDAYLAEKAAQLKSQHIHTALTLLNPLIAAKYLNKWVLNSWISSNAVTPANNGLNSDIMLTPSPNSPQQRNIASLSDGLLQLSYQYTPDASGSFNFTVLVGGEELETIQIAPISPDGTIFTGPYQMQVVTNVTTSSDSSSGQSMGTSSSSNTGVIAGGVAGGVVGVAGITTAVVLLVKYFKAKAVAAAAYVLPAPNNADDAHVEMDDVGATTTNAGESDGIPERLTPRGEDNSPRNSRDFIDNRPDLMQGSPSRPFGSGGADSAALAISMVSVAALSDGGSSSGLSPTAQPLLDPEAMSPMAASTTAVDDADAAAPFEADGVSSQEQEQSMEWDGVQQNPLQSTIGPVLLPSAPTADS